MSDTHAHLDEAWIFWACFHIIKFPSCNKQKKIFTVKIYLLKQKYILWKMESKTYLRFLNIIFIISAQNLFICVILFERFHLFFWFFLFLFFRADFRFFLILNFH